MSGLPETPALASKASFWRSVRMVAWSFLGIRQRSEFQQDLAQVNPLHILVVAIGGAVLFVFGLIVLVNWLVAK